jgi:hypothetical protein
MSKDSGSPPSVMLNFMFLNKKAYERSSHLGDVCFKTVKMKKVGFPSYVQVCHRVNTE